MDFLYFLQGIRNDFLDGLMSILTHLGGEIVVVAVLCTFFWCINKKTAYKLCFTYFISGLAIQGLKIACRVQRPWIRDSRLIPVESAVEDATGYSFPSGHTQSATGLYTGLAVHFKKVIGFVIGLFLTALVMFTRMYLGVHTPTDVLVSFAVTAVVAIGVDFVAEHFKASKKTNIILFIFIEIISFALIGYSAYVVASGKSTMELTMDCFKAAGAGIGFGIGWFVEVTWVNFNPKAVKNIWGHILKLVIGLGVAMLLKSGIKAIFGDICIVNIIRYIITIFWIVGGFPMLIKKFSKSE